MRTSVLIITLAALAGCSATPMATRSEQAEMRLRQLIDGRIAGAPERCLPYYRSGDMVLLDGGTVAFRDGDRVWVSRLRGGCTRTVGGNYALVTTSLGGFGLCSGDIAQMVDPSTGVRAGSCIIGDFVPYSRP